MSFLSPHRKTLNRVFPDMSYVTKYTIQTSDAGSHWFWHDGRKGHRHNALGHAFLAWRVKPTADSGWREHGDFCVARLHLAALYTAVVPRSRIASICGLPQCINPTHWRMIPPSPQWCFGRNPVRGWGLQRVSSGRMATQTLVVNVGYERIVHVAHVLPSGQVYYRDRVPTLCGLPMDPELATVTTAPVTCLRGCRHLPNISEA